MYTVQLSLVHEWFVSLSGRKLRIFHKKYWVLLWLYYESIPDGYQIEVVLCSSVTAWNESRVYRKNKQWIAEASRQTNEHKQSDTLYALCVCVWVKVCVCVKERERGQASELPVRFRALDRQLALTGWRAASSLWPRPHRHRNTSSPSFWPLREHLTVGFHSIFCSCATCGSSTTSTW